MKRIGILAAFAAAALIVSATPVMAQTTAIGTSGDPGSMGSLTTLLGSLYPSSTLVRVSDGGDQLWISEAGNSTAVARFAGDTNTFGYIGGWSGTPSATWMPQFTVTGGNGTLNPAVYTAALPTGGTQFRFGLSGGGNLFSSQNSDNIDGLDHMVTWYIAGGVGVGDYVVAFEDLPGPLGGGSDRDFNDLILTIAGARPTPEPGTLILLGSAAAGIYVWSRRRKVAVQA